MASKLCMNCFASYRPEVDGSLCPKCAWDNSKPQTPEGLELQTVLAGRYVVGRVRSMNSEGITYMALDRTTQRTVTVREFYPRPLSSRGTGQGIAPRKEDQGVFDKYADEFLELSKGVSRLRELSVIESVLDIFEENGTVYTVYRYTSTVSLRSYVEKNGRLGWNEADGPGVGKLLGYCPFGRVAGYAAGNKGRHAAADGVLHPCGQADGLTHCGGFRQRVRGCRTV